MKKTNCIIALLLCVFLLTPAMAEPEIREFEAAYGTKMDETTGLLVVRDGETDTYTLMTPEGEILTPEPYNKMEPDSGFFVVAMEIENQFVAKNGLMDSTGQMIIPMEYMRINVVSPRWQTAEKYILSGKDKYDYQIRMYGETTTDQYYCLDSVDFFFDGQKVGSLGYADYYPDSGVAYGAYITVRDREGYSVFYNSAIEKSPITTYSSSEYDYTYQDRKQIYIHSGSGQVVCVPECTLKPDEVTQSIFYIDGVFLDLQGNELFRPETEYGNVSHLGDGYFRFSIDGKYGVLNNAFEIIIPPEYDDISYEDIKTPNGRWYISAEKDGKFGYLDEHGNVTCDFVYDKNEVSKRGAFAEVKASDGSVIVLSAAVGELPERYSQAYNYSDMTFEVKNADGAYGFVYLNGKMLIPYSEEYFDVVDSTPDASKVLVRKNEKYMLYMFDESDLAIDEPVQEPAA